MKKGNVRRDLGLTILVKYIGQTQIIDIYAIDQLLLTLPYLLSVKSEFDLFRLFITVPL